MEVAMGGTPADSAARQTHAGIVRALKRARAEQKLTQQDIADALDVSRPYVVELEATRPVHQLDRLIKALHLVGLDLVAVPRDHPLVRAQRVDDAPVPGRVDRPR